MNIDDLLILLKQQSDSKYLEGMKRFGVDNSKAIGVSLPRLRKLAKSFKKDHQLALSLWATGIHECRIMASLVDDPAQVTPQQMDKWVHDFNTWDICDQACGNLFDRTPFALEKAVLYTKSEKEFVKRAGFVLMAEYAVHNKKAADKVFLALFPYIEAEAWNGRNFVKKAVNWALRQIGKRNANLNTVAIACAEGIQQQDTKAAKWIASNALAELRKR